MIFQCGQRLQNNLQMEHGYIMGIFLPRDWSIHNSQIVMLPSVCSISAYVWGGGEVLFFNSALTLMVAKCATSAYYPQVSL